MRSTVVKNIPLFSLPMDSNAMDLAATYAATIPFSAGFYLRTSVDDEACFGLDQQCDFDIGFGLEIGVTDFLLLADAGVSGRLSDRPAFNYLWKIVARGGLDAVIVQFTDRIGRRSSVVHHLLELCAHQGVRVFDAGNRCELVGFDATAQAARAEGDWSLRAARSELGRKIRVLNGKHPGKLPFGFAAGENRIVVRVEAALAIVRRIFRLACEGLLCPEIADILRKEGIPTPGEFRSSADPATFRAAWTPDMVRQIINRQVYRGAILLGLKIGEIDFDTGRRRVRKGFADQIIEGTDEIYRVLDDETWLKANICTSINYSPRAAPKSSRRPFTKLMLCPCGGRLFYASADQTACRRCGTAIAGPTELLDKQLIQLIVSKLPGDDRLSRMEDEYDTSVGAFLGGRSLEAPPFAPYLSRLFEAARTNGGSGSNFAILLQAVSSGRATLRIPFMLGDEIRQIRTSLRQEVDGASANAILRRIVESVELGGDGSVSIRFHGPLAFLGTQEATVDLVVGDAPPTVPERPAAPAAATPIAGYPEIWPVAEAVFHRFGIDGGNARDLFESALRAVREQTDWSCRPNPGVVPGDVAAFMGDVVRSGAWDALRDDGRVSRLLSFVDARRADALRRSHVVGVTPAEYASIDRERLGRLARDADAEADVRAKCRAVEMKLAGCGTPEILAETGVGQSNAYRLVKLVARKGLEALLPKKRLYLYDLSNDQIARLQEAVRQGLDPHHERPQISNRRLFELGLELGARFPDARAFHANLERRGHSMRQMKLRAIAQISGGDR